MHASKPMQVELVFTAKTYDVDSAGIVHNAVYIRWLEDLRLQVLAEYDALDMMFDTNLSPVLERTEIRYRRPLRLFEEAIGRMWVSKLGKARWDLEAEFVQGELIIAQAAQSGYFMDLESYRPVRVPATFRQKWEQEQNRSTSERK